MAKGYSARGGFSGGSRPASRPTTRPSSRPSGGFGSGGWNPFFGWGE